MLANDVAKFLIIFAFLLCKCGFSFCVLFGVTHLKKAACKMCLCVVSWATGRADERGFICCLLLGLPLRVQSWWTDPTTIPPVVRRGHKCLQRGLLREMCTRASLQGLPQRPTSHTRWQACWVYTSVLRKCTQTSGGSLQGAPAPRRLQCSRTACRSAGRGWRRRR